LTKHNIFKVEFGKKLKLKWWLYQFVATLNNYKLFILVLTGVKVYINAITSES